MQNYALAKSLKSRYLYVNVRLLEIFTDKNLYAITYEGRNHHNIFSSLTLAKMGEGRRQCQKIYIL